MADLAAAFAAAIPPGGTGAILGDPCAASVRDALEAARDPALGPDLDRRLVVARNPEQLRGHALAAVWCVGRVSPAMVREARAALRVEPRAWLGWAPQSPERLVELARAAFDAYCSSASGVAVTGRPIPPWAELGPDVRRHWTAAAEAVARGLGCT